MAQPRLVTRDDSILVVWDEQATGQHCQPFVVRVTQLALSSGKQTIPEKAPCHCFTRQLSESTWKPFIQHLIKAPLERLDREHRVYRTVTKTVDRSCSGSHGEAQSPEESLQDGFPEGMTDKGLENKAAWSSASCYCGDGPALGDS